jgi:hypothetical protein
MAGVFSRTRNRAAVGLIAAYAVALQTLFAAFATLPVHAAGGVDFSQVICFGNASAPAGDDGAPAPASGKLHCVLCVASGAAAILPEPAASAVAPTAALSRFAPVPVDLLLAPVAPRSGPSRAPPFSV